MMDSTIDSFGTGSVAVPMADLGTDGTSSGEVETDVNVKTSGYVVKLANVTITFNKLESFCYQTYFQILCSLDVNVRQQVQADDAMDFLRRSYLPRHTIQSIWRISCDGENRPSLKLDEFMIALKLVALAQTSPEETSLKLLEETKQLPLAKFGILAEAPRNFNSEGALDYSKKMIEVTVCDPKLIGSGLSKFINYTICLKTTLPHFLRKEATVHRRYSDIRWLHDYLRERLPSTVLPPLPAKQLLGNFENTFVEERRVALEQYVDHLSRHFRLSRLFEVQVLLLGSNRALALLKALVFKLRNLHEESNKTLEPSDWLVSLFYKASSMLRGHVDDKNIAAQERRIRDEKRGLGIEKVHMSKIRNNLKTYNRNLFGLIFSMREELGFRRSKGYELTRFGHYLQRLADVENLFSREELTWIKESGQRFETCGNELQDLNQSLNKALARLEYQKGLIKQVQKVLSTHDKQFEALQRAHDDLALSKQKYATVRASTSSSMAVEEAYLQTVKIEERIMNIEDSLRALNKSIEIEINKFNTEKSLEIKETLESLATAEMDYHGEQVKLLSDFASMLEADLDKTRLNSKKNASFLHD